LLRTRVMPCLLLSNDGLVKTIKFKSPAYVGDPINTVRIFNEKEVDELILLDITASRNNRPPQYALIEEIASECFMPLAYGGGVKSVEDARKIFSLGLEKVVLNTSVLENPDLISQLAEQFGSQSLVVSVDVKKDLFGRYRVYSKSGTKKWPYEPEEFAKLMEERGAGEILLNSIDRDGTMIGYDIPLIQRVSRSVGLPVISCGGAGQIDDFSDAVNQGGASAVAAGSMVVYQGKNRSVLINFPTQQQLHEVLGKMPSNNVTPV